MGDAKSKFLIDTKSNTHYEAGKLVLELSEHGLKEYFKVDEVRISQ